MGQALSFHFREQALIFHREALDAYGQHICDGGPCWCTEVKILPEDFRSLSEIGENPVPFRVN